MKLGSVERFIVNNGFVKINNHNFLRKNNKFINCINFQKKSAGDLFFINMGVHPVFDEVSELPTLEIDCYIRHRLKPSNELKVSLLNSTEGKELIINDIEQKVIPFFSFFSSMEDVFDSICVIDLELENIACQLSSATNAILALMIMNYHLNKNNLRQACEFAVYGLSVSKGPGTRRQFKNIIKNLA